jgi:hypothetical protein
VRSFGGCAGSELARFGRLDRAENGKQLEGELAILAEVQVTIENGRVSWWVRRIVGAGGGGRGWWPAGGGRMGMGVLPV